MRSVPQVGGKKIFDAGVVPINGAQWKQVF